MLLAPLPPLEIPRRDQPRRPLRPAILAPAPGQETSTGTLQGDYSYGFAIADFLGLHDREYQYFVIGVLLDRLPRDVAQAAVTELIIPHALKPTSGVAPPPDLMLFHHRKALASAAPYLFAEQRRSLLAEIFVSMSFTASDAESEAPFLARFAPFSENEVAEAFAALENAHPFSWWPESALMTADVLAHRADKKTLEKIRECVMTFPVEQECFAALAALAQLQPGTARDDIAMRALAIAASIRNPLHKVRAVAELAPILFREDLATRAFNIVAPIGPFAGVWAMDAMADVLPPQLLRAAVKSMTIAHPAEHIPRILARLAAEGDTTVIDSVLPRLSQHKAVECLAPLLTAPQARTIWHLWDRENLRDDQAQGLAALIACLPEDERAAAADQILAAHTPSSLDGGKADARVLSLLARVTSTEQLTRRLHELLVRGGIVLEWVMAELASVLPETLIETALQRALSADDDICCQALAILAPRLSGALLNRAIIHVDDMRYYGHWKTAALGALALQLPHNREEREIMLEKTLEARPSPPETMVSLIPHLSDRLRPQAIRATVKGVCSNLRYDRRTPDDNFDTLHALLAALSDPELEALYVRLGEEVQAPPIRAHAQAAVIRQAGTRNLASFFTNGRTLYQDWPGESDRAGLMDLIAAAAWWIGEHGEDIDIDEVIQAIFDVTRWWP